jgi:hypothetical protein
LAPNSRLTSQRWFSGALEVDIIGHQRKEPVKIMIVVGIDITARELGG